MRVGFRGAAACAVCIADNGAVVAGSPPGFTEEAGKRGIDYYVGQGTTEEQFGCGLGFVDLDADGDPDVVLLGRVDGVVGIYENDGTGHFIDRTELAGIPPMDSPSGVSAADFDKDGDLDLYVTNWVATNALLVNMGGFEFVDVAEAAGVDDDGAGMGSVWADYDLDGWLDLYVGNRTNTNYAPQPNRLYRNLGDGTFEDVAAALGVDDDEPTFQPVFFDMDRDGDADLYLSTDKGISCNFTNHLFENVGGMFIEITEASGTEACIDSMGVAVGDFNGNRQQDLYCTNVPMGNPLFINGGDGVFTEVSEAAGVASYATGWGAWFFDYDHDTVSELFVCNMDAPNRLYDAETGWPCDDMAPLMGLDDPGLSYATAFADIENDGDLDLLVQNYQGDIRLYVNQTNDAGHWVKIRLAAENGNTHGIGAIADVRVGDTWMLRELFAGTSYKSQNELVLHWGLGDATEIDEVVVSWPGGATITRAGLEADRTWWLYPPGVGGDVDGDGSVGVSDLIELIVSWGPCGGADCPGDLNGDTAVDVLDLVQLIVSWGS